jgi:L,D-transpeptidase ErfK/SrfK
MISVKTFIFSCFLLITSVALGAEMMIGGITHYTVQKGDRLELIGAKLGVFWKNIAKENNLDPKMPCVPGQVLKVNTNKIVPRIIDDGIIVNIADRTLYYFKMGKLTVYPVGVGLAREDDFGDWRTPTGKFVIVGKRKNPTWSVPDSIQLEMAFKGKEVEETVPPGPKNPLGRYAIQTSIPGVLIHETIWPSSVYRFQSHGCIRMLPENMEKFFEEVEKGIKGEIIYEPVKIMLTQDGKPYLEVRTDTYRRFSSLKDLVWKLIDERGIRDKVDVNKVEQLIKDQSGVAEDITFYPKEGPIPYMMKTLYQRFFDFFKPQPKSEKSS